MIERASCLDESPNSFMRYPEMSELEGWEGRAVH